VTVQPDDDRPRRAELRKRGDDAHPLTIRAAIGANGCGYRLTGEAIAGGRGTARNTP
jgi:hypothetical protein